MSEIDSQLSLGFFKDNRLEHKLDSGQFLYFLELNTPPLAHPYDSAIALTASLASELNSVPEISAVTVTDRLATEKSHDPVETALRLSRVVDKPVILTLSGKGSSLERIQTHIATAKSSGIRNLLAVTGDISDLHPYNAFSKLQEYDNGYLDSVDILRTARKMSGDFRLGAVVNPFKYTPEGQCLQYAKMMKKIACGAQMIFTQAGWDMKKAQELQWFLRRRQQSLMVIARIPLIHLDEARKLAAGYQPGIYIPVPVATEFMQDARLELDQYLARQVDRIALQIIGYRALGYSGIQFTGVRSPSLLKSILQKVAELQAVYPDYDSWLKAWNQHYGEVNLAPMVAPHYLFRNLLRENLCEYDAAKAQISGTALVGPRVFDIVRYRLLSLVFAEKTPAFLKYAVSFLYGYSQQELAGLAPCLYLNHRMCPKRLSQGPCGGACPDGGCECQSGRPCFFHRVLHLAAFLKDFSILEKLNDDTAKQQ